MGCWNGTCMISNLPIISGEKVKLIFLKKGHDEYIGNAAVCYPVGLLKPLNMALTAVYNDYGSVEKIEEDWNYNIISKYFKEYFKKGIRCDGTEKIKFELTDIIDAIERGELESHIRCGILHEYEYMHRLNKLKEDKAHMLEVVAEVDNIMLNWKKETKEWFNVEMSFVMIRQDVWDKVVENFSTLKDYFYGINIPHSDEITYASYFEIRWNNYIEKFKKAVSEKEKFRFILDSENNIFSGNSESSPLYIFSAEYAKYLQDALNNNEDISNIKKQWTESKMVESYVSRTRKTWMIQAGAGSQNADYDLMVLHGQMIVDIANKKLKEDEEENYEDDYEEANS